MNFSMSLVLAAVNDDFSVITLISLRKSSAVCPCLSTWSQSVSMIVSGGGKNKEQADFMSRIKISLDEVPKPKMRQKTSFVPCMPSGYATQS